MRRACLCRAPREVLHFHCWYSRPTKTSTVRCFGCGATWRTSAAYVEKLPLAPEAWIWDVGKQKGERFDPDLDAGAR